MGHKQQYIKISIFYFTDALLYIIIIEQFQIYKCRKNSRFSTQMNTK